MLAGEISSSLPFNAQEGVIRGMQIPYLARPIFVLAAEPVNEDVDKLLQEV